MATFVSSAKRFFITKKKEGPGEVVFRDLPEKYKKVFRKSRDKEIESLLKSGAITILSLKDSREFANKFPEYVLTSRYVDRWKPLFGSSGILGSFSLCGRLRQQHGRAEKPVVRCRVEGSTCARDRAVGTDTVDLVPIPFLPTFSTQEVARARKGCKNSLFTGQADNKEAEAGTQDARR